jgi:hypothetical protein
MFLTSSKGKNPFVLVYRHNDGNGGHNEVHAMYIKGKGVLMRTTTTEYNGYATDNPSAAVAEALEFIPGVKLYADGEIG